MTARITDGKAAKKVQSTLAIPHTHVTRTCTQCGMTYNPLLAADVGVHAKYHDNFTNGISWPPMLQSPQHAAETVFVTLKRKTTKRGSLKSIVTREGKSATIQIVDKLSSKQVDKVETMMAMVNSELNAVDDSKQWRSAQFESSKAFVLVIDNRAVGLCTTDTIQHGEWLIHKTQSLVPNRKISSCRVGISRIWIAPKWRQNGLAGQLLRCVMKNSVYGTILSKNQIAFSQPSFGGGLLAKSFNGVRHKSGEILIPVYTEEQMHNLP